MLRFRLQDVGLQTSSVTENDAAVEDEYARIDAKVRAAKSLLDHIDERSLHQSVLRNEPLQSDVLKDAIIRKHKLPREHVTNAFLKLYEILHEYETELCTVTRSMHYAEFPGSFVTALDLFLKSKREESGSGSFKLDWQLQSFNPPSLSSRKGDPLHKVLRDSFGFQASHPERVLCSAEAAYGDLTCAQSLQYYASRFARDRMDLVTADGSIDPSSDYNRQEELCLPLLRGEIFAACASVRRGGSFICKVFGLLHPETRACVAFLTTRFRRVDIVKVLTSRVSNSEFYLVCLDFNEDTADSGSIDPETFLRRSMTSVMDRQLLAYVSRSLLPFVRERTHHQCVSIEALHRDSARGPSARNDDRVDLTEHWLRTCRFLHAD